MQRRKLSAVQKSSVFQCCFPVCVDRTRTAALYYSVGALPSFGGSQRHFFLEGGGGVFPGSAAWLQRGHRDSTDKAAAARAIRVVFQ